MRKVLSVMVGAAIALTTSLVGAQDLSGTMQTSGGSSGGSSDSITSTAGATDHSVVVNRLGLRYFGATTLPSLSAMGTMGGSGTLHTVGARYWLSGGLAIEGGLALGFNSGGTTTTVTAGAGTNTVSSDIPNFFGIGVQIGLPIMLAEAKHLVIHADPFLAFHYGTSAISTTPERDVQNDVSLNALRLGVGVNATAELQFGFLGIPQLGLQASIGFSINYLTSSQNTVRTTTRMGEQPRTETTTSNNAFNFGTTVGPNYSLSEIITGSISAVYYFGNAPSR